MIQASKILQMLKQRQTALFDKKFSKLPNYQYALYFPISPAEENNLFPADLRDWPAFLEQFETEKYKLSFDYDPGYPELLLINRELQVSYENTPKPHSIDDLIFLTQADSNFAYYYPHDQLTAQEFNDLLPGLIKNRN